LQQLRRDGHAHNYLLRLRRADNSAMWVEVTARAEPLPNTATLRVEALMRDVTERKKLQDQARDLYLQLSQAERLAALGQTMSGVAHELNNPLATILACAERLQGRRLDELTRRDLEGDPQRLRARRPDRPEPADVRAQASHDAHDRRSESGRARDAGAARLRTARGQCRDHRGAGGPGCRRCLPIPTRSSKSC
jgi:signal transduction histidine kinase